MGKKSREIRDKDPDDLEPGEYSVGMTIAEDCKGFDLNLRSPTPMNSEQIVLAIESWLYENILEDKWPGEHIIQ